MEKWVTQPHLKDIPAKIESFTLKVRVTLSIEVTKSTDQ